MTYTAAATSKALRSRNSAKRKIRVALATALVAASLVLPSLAAGLVAPPAHAASNTFLVTNTNDSGVGSLRRAILDANATTDADVIKFAIPGTGVQTIKPSTALPVITNPVTIDGYSQQGAQANTKAVGDDASLKIELDGTNVPSANGLSMDDLSDNSVIRGLVINRFGTGVAATSFATGIHVEGNFIGTDPIGTIDKGNVFNGVDIEGNGLAGVMVGGTTPAARNLISGNGNDGVFMDGFSSSTPADSLRVQGNYIGTDRSGTKDLGNGFGGIFLDHATGTIIGGTTAASRNVISGNSEEGAALISVSGTKMLGNRIGTTASGTGALGNGDDGVFIVGVSSNNAIGDGTSAGSNTIAFNGKDGVQIFDPTNVGNEISHNSVFSNVGLGVDLVGPGENFTTNTPTPNDGDNPNTAQVDPDGDTGPNGLQNKPVLASAATSSTATTVKGTLDSTPGANFTLEFYANPSGADEGQRFIGEQSVTTDASGEAPFSFQSPSKVAAGQNVTVTATDASTKDTSEFSAPVSVKDAAAPRVKSVSPAENATGVSPSANVAAVFSEAMKSSTVNATTVKLRKAGTTTNVSATVSYNQTTHKATLNPGASLRRGAKYVVTATTGAQDLAGNALDQDPAKAGNQAKVWSFTVHR